ncbi:MAG: hypothetical protein JWO38_713 [Gemmataceae bacterium]|nr:hypothetical protein [Gemmataceae bacterium]
MRSLTIIAACVFAAGLAALVVRTCAADRGPGSSEAVLSRDPDDPFGKTRGAELDDSRQRLIWQIEQADAIADELIADRTTLAAATARLEEINQNRSVPILHGLRRSYRRPTASDRELYARYAVSKVRARLAEDPARLAEIAPRLNAEFRALVPTDEQVLDTGDPGPRTAAARAWPGYGPGQVRCE